MKTIAAIDPDSKGAIAYRSTDGAIAVVSLPSISSVVDSRELHRVLMAIAPEFTLVEKQWIHPTDGLKYAAGSIENYGRIMACAAIACSEVQTIAARSWQSALHIPPSTKRGGAKRGSIAMAAHLFPAVSLIPEGKRSPHPAYADALCILRVAIAIDEGA